MSYGIAFVECDLLRLYLSIIIPERSAEVYVECAVLLAEIVE